MRFVRTAESLFGLPLGFQRVEYLESSGTQYIDTGYIQSGIGLKVDIVAEKTSSATSEMALIGRSSGGGFELYSYNNKIGLWNTTDANSISVNTSMTQNEKFHFIGEVKTNSLSLNINGSETTKTATTAEGTDPLTATITLFRHNSKYNFIGKMYRCRIWENDTLIYDFIPCLDASSVPCMYDLVGKKPYYNQGTGTFTAGRQVIPVEYLESTGTQYVDTGVRGFADFEIGVKLRENTSNVSIFCSHGYRLERYNASNPYWRFRNDNDFYNSGVPITEYHVMAWKNDEVYADGVKLQDFTKTWNVPANMTLFGSSTSGSYPNMIYWCKLWDPTDGTLLRDFIPAKDENGNGFLFDRLSGVCYLNAGTGAFSVGENKYTSKLRLIKEAVLLPDGYKRVEYLQSDGNQYIDTEYTINTATDEVLFNFQMISTTLYQWIMGEHDNGARFGIGVGDGTNKRNIAYGSTTYKVNDTEIYNSIHYFKANSNGVYLNGTQVHGFETFSSSSTIYLFRLNLSGANGAAGKIWRYVQKRNGVLIRDMIPCLDPNNTPCMFDLVEGKPYYNQGTGNFTYGHTITPVEYLESSGTQYIDTGYIPSNTTGQYAKMQYTTINNGVTFGGMVSGNGVVGPYYATSSSNVGWWMRWGTNEPRVIAPTPKITDTYEMYLNFNNDRIAKVDNTVITSGLESISGNYPSLTLFRRNYSSGYAYLSGKIFSYKITEGTEVVRSLIPVRDENNVGYMFDKVTGQLFGNAGSGSFGIGNDLPKPKVRFIQDVLPREYLPLKCLKSTGTQWINTGVYGNLNTKIEAKVYSERVSGADSGYCIAGDFTTSTKAITMPFNFVGDALYSRFGDKAITTGIQQQAGTYTFAVDKGGYYVDGTKIATFNTTTSFTTDGTIMLFGFTGLGRNYFIGNMYKCIIWDNGVPVRDLYPALRKSDNKAGMYDRITKQFFVNQGTGDFNYE